MKFRDTMAVAILALALVLLPAIAVDGQNTTRLPPTTTTVGPTDPGIAALQTLAQTLNQMYSQLSGTFI